MAIKVPKIGEKVARGSQNLLQNVRSVEKEKRTNMLQDAAEVRREAAEERMERQELRQEELHNERLNLLQSQNKGALYQLDKQKAAQQKQQWVVDTSVKLGEKLEENKKSKNPRDVLDIMDEVMTNNVGKPGSPSITEFYKYQNAIHADFWKSAKQKFDGNPEKMMEYINNSWYGKRYGKVHLGPEGVTIENSKTGETKRVTKKSQEARKREADIESTKSLAEQRRARTKILEKEATEFNREVENIKEKIRKTLTPREYLAVRKRLSEVSESVTTSLEPETTEEKMIRQQRLSEIKDLSEMLRENKNLSRNQKSQRGRPASKKRTSSEYNTREKIMNGLKSGEITTNQAREYAKKAGLK